VTPRTLPDVLVPRMAPNRPPVLVRYDRRFWTAAWQRWAATAVTLLL